MKIELTYVCVRTSPILRCVLAQFTLGIYEEILAVYNIKGKQKSEILYQRIPKNDG